MLYKPTASERSNISPIAWCMSLDNSAYSKFYEHGKSYGLFRALLFIITIFLLSGCTGAECYDADDFGFANFDISSRYTEAEMNNQSGANQVAPWRYSNYRVNGRPLAILVKYWEYDKYKNSPGETSAWCAWFGTVNSPLVLSDFCERLQDCSFVDDQMCTDDIEANIPNAPCVFRKGIGLYALIAKDVYNPNVAFSTMRNPKGLTFHLGEPLTEYKMLDITKDGKHVESGGLVYKYDNQEGKSADQVKGEYVDSMLYFKILDRFYDDNSGKYKISIKSGVTDVNPDPIQFVINLVEDYLFGTGSVQYGSYVNEGSFKADEDSDTKKYTDDEGREFSTAYLQKQYMSGSGKDGYGLIQNLYTGIVSNPGYRFAVSALLVLFIVYTTLSYLSGNIDITQTELVTRVAKIAIISALIGTEGSWNFFYENLFVYFVGGLKQVLSIITEAGASGPGASGILGMMIAPQTMAKLFALLFMDWKGFIYIFLFFFALYFVLKVFFHAAIIYLTALMTIGLILVMAPIFLCFMLFGFTRSLFENWLKQLISYSLQPILLFAGLVFIAAILREEIYGSLGFRVCKHYFPKLSTDRSYEDIWGEVLGDEDFSLQRTFSIFYWWFPEPMKAKKFTREKVMIPIPIDHFTKDGDFCEAYGCNGERYPDLPFLNPETKRGRERLNDFWNGRFVQLDGLFLIFVALFLLQKFNGTVISIAKFISNTSGNLTGIGSVARSAIQGDSHSISSFKREAGIEMQRTGIGRKYMETKQSFRAMKEGIKQAPGKYYDHMAIKRLRNEAMTKDANSQVLKEVKLSTGLTQSDVVKGSRGEYSDALTNSMKTIDPSLTDKQARNLGVKMSKVDAKQLPNEFAKAKYGKDYKDLNQLEQAQVQDLMNQKHNGKSMQRLAVDAADGRRFQEAYVDAHQKLSYKGVNVFGKKSTTLRSVQELKHNAKETKEINKQKRMARGDQIMSDVEKMKSTPYDAAIGRQANKSLGKGEFGGAYHDIDREDPSLRTYNEVIKDNKESLKQKKYNDRLDAINKAQGTSVVSPEYLGRLEESGHPKLNAYKSLAREGVNNDVKNELKQGPDPILKGEKYMKHYAKDSELAETIDRMQAKEQEIFKKDTFIAREEKYQLSREEAIKNMEAERKVLQEHTGRNDIRADEMPALLDEYLKSTATPGQEREVRDRVAKLEKSMSDYESSQKALKQIEERKDMVRDAIGSHINHINDIRQSAGMERYYGKSQEAGPASPESPSGGQAMANQTTAPAKGPNQGVGAVGAQGQDPGGQSLGQGPAQGAAQAGPQGQDAPAKAQDPVQRQTPGQDPMQTPGQAQQQGQIDSPESQGGQSNNLDSQQGSKGNKTPAQPSQSYSSKPKTLKKESRNDKALDEQLRLIREQQSAEQARQKQEEMERSRKKKKDDGDK